MFIYFDFISSESQRLKTYIRTSAQRRLGSACAFAQSYQTSLGPFWIAKAAKFLRVDNEDYNQTARVRRVSTHMSEGTFSHVEAHINFVCLIVRKWGQSYTCQKKKKKKKKKKN